MGLCFENKQNTFFKCSLRNYDFNNIETKIGKRIKSIAKIIIFLYIPQCMIIKFNTFHDKTEYAKQLKSLT